MSNKYWSKGEETLAFHFRVNKINYVREYRFAADAVGMGDQLRKRLDANGLKDWRFDFLIGDKIGVEVEGGAFTGGRHVRGSGFSEDCRKYNAAALLGFTVYRFTTEQVASGEAIEFLIKALAIRPPRVD